MICRLQILTDVQYESETSKNTAEIKDQSNVPRIGHQLTSRFQSHNSDKHFYSSFEVPHDKHQADAANMKI